MPDKKDCAHCRAGANGSAYATYDSLVLAVALFLAVSFVLLSGCIETIPREGIPSTVSATIETGSDVCIGWDQSSCGAIIKEKRVTPRVYTCRSPIGPADAYVGNFTYNLSAANGWSCVEEESPISITLPSQATSNGCNVGNGGSCERTSAFSSDFFFTGINRIVYDCSLGYSITFSGSGIANFYASLGGDVKTFPIVMGGGNCAGYKGGGGTFSSTVPFSLVQPGNQIMPPEGDTATVNFGFDWKINAASSCHYCKKGPLGIGWKCSNPGRAHVLSSYSLSCGVTGYYDAKWRCDNSVTHTLSKFVECDITEAQMTFQGGNMYLQQPIPHTALGDMMARYYTIGAQGLQSGTKQVPFFMIGQGPTFDAFEKAREKCNPFSENILDVSLGPTTFDPPELLAPVGIDICFNNTDKRSHTITVKQLGSVIELLKVPLDPKQNLCPNSTASLKVGTYIVTDSNSDTALINITERNEDSQFYIGSKITPEYGVVTQGKNAVFNVADRNEHNLTFTHNAVFENNMSFSLNLENKTKSINTTSPLLQLGEHSVKDISTNATAIIFVSSPTNLFTFYAESGSVTPDYIARPYGDDICFTSDKEMYINIYKSMEGDWKLVTLDKSVNPGHTCCIENPVPGNYFVNSSDTNATARFYIGSRKPTATLLIKEIGFVPPKSTAEPVARICWINPTIKKRTVVTNGGDIWNRAIVVLPLSTDCSLRIDQDGIYTTDFSPDLNVSSITVIKKAKTYYIQVLALGFDRPFLQVKAGDKVCWVNADENEHKLTDQRNRFIELAKGQAYCVNSTGNRTLYWMRHDSVNITSAVSSSTDYAMFMSDIGLAPRLLSAETNKTVYFVNGLQSNQVSLTSQIDLHLSAYGAVLTTGVSISPVRLMIDNVDKVSHTVTISGGSPGSVTVGPNSNAEVSILGVGKHNITDSVSGEINYLEIKSIDGVQTLSSLAPGETKTWKPDESSAGQYSITENLRNTTASIAMMPQTGVAALSIFNETMDLPVQKVSGYVTSEVLAKMREYANRGLVPTIVPNFESLEVKIKTSLFNPNYMLVKPGSNITWVNTDNAAHTLLFTELEYRADGGIERRDIYYITLGVGEKYVRNAKKNVVYNVTGSGEGIVNATALDVDIFVGFAKLFPSIAEVSPSSSITISNYADINYSLTTSFARKTAEGEAGVPDTSEVLVEGFSSTQKAPGTYTFQLDGEGIFTFANPSLGRGTVHVSDGSSRFDVSVSGIGFNVSSIKMDGRSKLCIQSQGVKHKLNVYRDGKLITTGIAWGAAPSASEVCAPTFDCAAKSGTGIVCSGKINSTDSRCTYKVVDPGIGCNKTNGTTCVSNAPEIACSYDSSLQKCAFKASSTAADKICGGGCSPKEPSIGDTLSCAAMGDKCAFTYNAGKNKIAGSNVFCEIFKGTLAASGSNDIVCTSSPFGKYSDVGCAVRYNATTGAKDLQYCDLTPPLEEGGVTLNTNKFCTVSHDYQCPTGYTFNNDWTDPKCSKETTCYYAGDCNKCGKVWFACQSCYRPCTDYKPLASFTTHCTPTSDATCTPFEYSCKYAQWAKCSNPENCPCVSCGVNPAYSGLSNVQCTPVVGDCVLTSQWMIDSSITNYCNKSTGETCVANPNLAGVFCGMDAGSCTLTSEEAPDTQGLCGKTQTGCEAKYPGFNCTYEGGSCVLESAETAFCWSPGAGSYLIEDPATKARMVVEGYDKRSSLDIDLQRSYIRPATAETSPGSELCFISSDGVQHTLKVPIDLNKAGSINVGTSPNCMHIPEGIWGLQITDPALGRAFAASMEIISSIDTNAIIEVKYKLFEPEIGILRPGSNVTFTNLDREDHTIGETRTEQRLMRYSAEYSGPAYIAQTLVSKPWIAENKTSGIDILTNAVPTYPRKLSKPMGCVNVDANTTECCWNDAVDDCVWKASGTDEVTQVKECKTNLTALCYGVTVAETTAKDTAIALCYNVSYNVTEDITEEGTSYTVTGVIAATELCHGVIANGSAPDGTAAKLCYGYAPSATAYDLCGAILEDAADGASVADVVTSYPWIAEKKVAGTDIFTNETPVYTEAVKKPMGCVNISSNLAECCSNETKDSCSWQSTSGVLGTSSVLNCTTAMTIRCYAVSTNVIVKTPEISNVIVTELNSNQVKAACGENGNSAKRVELELELPKNVVLSKISAAFNDNGKIEMNNHSILEYLPNTRKCAYTTEDKMSSPSTEDVPLAYIDLSGAKNRLAATVCNCQEKSGLDISLLYEYIPADAWILTSPFTIPAGRSYTVPAQLLTQGEHVFTDSRIARALKISLKECAGTDMKLIADRIKSYELSSYEFPKNLACDPGKQPDCKAYNPYGPATVAILTTEENLNMSKPSEAACAMDQLYYMKASCPKCTTALFMGKTDLDTLNRTIMNWLNLTGGTLSAVEENTPKPVTGSFTINGDTYLVNNGTLTVTASGNFTLTGGNLNKDITYAITDGTMGIAGGAFYLPNNDYLTVLNGTAKVTGGSSFEIANGSFVYSTDPGPSSGTFKINSGAFATDPQVFKIVDANAIIKDNGFIITGGTFKPSGRDVIRKAKATLTGGTFATSEAKPVIRGIIGGTVAINADKFTITDGTFITIAGALEDLDLIAHTAIFNDYTGDVCKALCDKNVQNAEDTCTANAIEENNACNANASATNEAKAKCRDDVAARKDACLKGVLNDKNTCTESCNTCSIENVMNEKVALSKFALYTFKKPSILLEMGAREGTNTAGTCNWTNASIIQAYSDFYDWWIPILAGSGTIGAAQYCFQDQCLPVGDAGDYGLVNEKGKDKAWTGAWFKEGCGNYYYKAEGLMPLTFSMVETNYSLCDPSRMFALVQQLRCALEKQGVDINKDLANARSMGG